MTVTQGRAVGPPDLFDRGETVALLRALAAEERLGGRSSQLGRLADDLDADRDLERWAAVDLYAAFLREDTVGDRAEPAFRRRAGTVLDLLPAVLIFLPIMLTWVGLYKATSAYRKSRGDTALAGKSFLEQWQTGFNGRLGGGFYFDRIALWTLLAIGVLITISLAQALHRRASDRADARERARLGRDLAGALTAADFHLGRFRLDDASRVDHAARRLEDAAEEARKAGTAAGDLQREAQRAMERVETLAAALLKSDDAVRAAAERIGDATEGVGRRLTEVSAASASVADAAAELGRSATADSERLREGVAAAAAELRTAADADRERLGDRIAAALDSGGTALRAALDDWRTEGALYSHRHETTAEHLGLIVGRVEELMDRTSRALGGMEPALQDFEDGVSAAVSAMRMELDRLLDGMPLADKRADAVIAEFAELRRSMDDLCDRLGRTGGRRRWFR
ncbi:hypothetical protein [Actinomadura decatromicini]|uniref:Uncharacterized protein n=1 Tax=Actinomadura decatromicini TaxID=2604572 RepID=A0A5D3FF88_9ACTN|nr:hypothetical protein [Actinomadura decatromicini]TYK45965.1 hypothetical protein FXF68_27495 [Actinomadura decatromicini]